MVVLQFIAIIVTAFSGWLGFSTKFFFLINPKLIEVDRIYRELMSRGQLTEPEKIRNLLSFTRGDIKWMAESPEFSHHGMMRRWKEVSKLVFKAGELDQRPENKFGVLHPIYGYTEKGEECLVAGQREFHYLYSNLCTPFSSERCSYFQS